MAFPLLAAALIVKDESANVPGCLAALDELRPLLDHVVVYDTGSSDDTREIARSFGAKVVEGYWDGDFARARNAAVDMVRARWVLIVDADERMVADSVRLRAQLQAALRPGTRLDALEILMTNVDADGREGYAMPSVRLFRPDRACYVGRLHERVEARRPGARLRRGGLDREVAHVRHFGYRDVQVVRGKVERNLAMATADVVAAEASSASDLAELARALYHRGRTLRAAGHIAAARADLERAAELPISTRECIWARDVLAQLLLGMGEVEPVEALVRQLRADGVGSGWCAWLSAQALLAREGYADALPLLREVDQLVDAVGGRHDLAPVVEAHLLAAGRTGAIDEATACCIRLMAGFGRAEGYGSLLLTLWGNRPAEWLADLLIGADGGNRQTVAAELRTCRAPGPFVADLLAATPVPQELPPPVGPASQATASSAASGS